ncbi:hypothetical protein ZHAS_00013120 [Anopheles sinensis]|uniref:Uncharacterized protein n=1 Tax=Anopheles sinensis TaxID=74873 RepID=A0A084W4L9_ANOSI|nr:hypothetical protein ZHAS_00013120 [Anopheles sinensis]
MVSMMCVSRLPRARRGVRGGRTKSGPLASARRRDGGKGIVGIKYTKYGIGFGEKAGRIRQEESHPVWNGWRKQTALHPHISNLSSSNFASERNTSQGYRDSGGRGRAEERGNGNFFL